MPNQAYFGQINKAVLERPRLNPLSDHPRLSYI